MQHDMVTIRYLVNQVNTITASTLLHCLFNENIVHSSIYDFHSVYSKLDDANN